jgi:hypothetical protein
MIENEALMIQESVEDWVMDKCDEWANHYDQNYRNQHEEYYRLWRGIWSSEDKTRESERSRIITPALQQAVESNVAEIEEATFGRGKWFDIKDDLADQQKGDIQVLRELLHQDFEKAKIRKAISECLINSAVYGTGMAEVVLETVKEMAPATEPMMDGQMEAVGVRIKERTMIKLKPVMPQNFLIDPVATSIEEALGVAIDEFVPMHSVEMLQEQGVYKDVEIGIAPSDIDLEPDAELSVYPENKVRLTRYYGLVPTYLLKDAGEDVPEDAGQYTEAVIVIANGGTLLKAKANPYMMQDRPVVAFSWDVVPSRFWGRGVCEKGYNSQKALDAEIRARIDALALTVHPMMAMDATRIPRGTKPEVRPGKILLTNGDPKEVLNPFNFGSVSQITFNQAAALQTMVQQSTGAIDSAGVSGAINGEATASGISMSLGAIIKRHKRTLINFQDNFLIPFVTKAAHRYMQFEPEEYPVSDYKFLASSTLGIIAREYEVTQLVQLLQTMKQDSPVYNTLIQSIVDNMNLSNREELVQALAQASQPNPQAQQEAQARLQSEIAFQQAQTQSLQASAMESQARAQKYAAEVEQMPAELQLDAIKAANTNLSAGTQDDKEFERRVKIAELMIKEKQANGRKPEATTGRNRAVQQDFGADRGSFGGFGEQ